MSRSVPVAPSLPEPQPEPRPTPARVAEPTTRGQRTKAAQARAEVPPVWLERPAPVKHPRDWRWYVGGLGRILISLGLLIFAFVAYQLWGTGIQYNQHQNDLRRDFEALLAEAPALPPVTTVASRPDTSISQTTVEGAVAPPAAPETTLPAAPTIAAPLPPIALGDAIAYIEIPSINLTAIIVAGVRTDDLKKGVGHFPSSPLPGQPGNAALAGHRTTNGQPFIDIDRVQIGDEIIVKTLQGRYVYRMTGQQIVKPSDGQVVANQPDKKMLTLTSCNPKYSAKQRIVVTADLDEAASSPLGAATANYLDPATAALVPAPVEPLPGEDVDSATTVVDGVVPTDTLADPAEAPTTDPNGEVDPVDGVSESFDESVDALSAGWFSDPNAWPQIALWGMGLTLLALAAWRLSKKVHRNWVGALVGIGPFVVMLYFFFENVNRLLPPNL